MRLRNGMVLTNGIDKVKVVQRNCSRSQGMVKYKLLGDNTIKEMTAEKFSHNYRNINS